MFLFELNSNIPQPAQSLEKSAVVWVDTAEQTRAACSPGGKFRRAGLLILLPRELM